MKQLARLAREEPDGHPGTVEGALETAKANGDGSTGVFANIAYEQAKAGEVKAAVRTAQLLEDSWWRGKALGSIAKIQAEQGQEKDALAWIGQLTSSFERAHALLGVADGLTRRQASAKQPATDVRHRVRGNEALSGRVSIC